MKCDENGFDFDTEDLKPIRIPVKYKGKNYFLCEPSGAAAAAYRNCVFKSTRLGPNGKPVGIEGLGDAEAVLVQGCLFEVMDKKEDGEPVLGVVALGWVKQMPNRVLRPLFDKAQEIGNLKERPQTVDEINKQVAELLELRDELLRGEDAPKDTPADTTPGST